MIGRRIGRYTVEDWIGQGGMASVWRVTDDEGATWALKVLSLQKPEVRQRFRMEARVQLGLSHPNVVGAREELEVDGEPALVLQYVPGGSLDRWLLDRNPPFEVRDALAGQILAGVAYAHAQGLVHRDLKPANVLVDETSGAPVARLTDFGLVKEQGTGATRTGIALGTPRYMAPEQIRDAKRVDARADVWSLGALLYELYTDRSPFHRDTLFDTFTAVVDGAYQDPGELGVPDRVRHAIRACLHVDPGLRVQRVSDLVRLLTGAASPDDVVPRVRVPTTAPESAEPVLGPPVAVRTPAPAHDRPPLPPPLPSTPPPKFSTPPPPPPLFAEVAPAAPATMAPPSPTLVASSWPPAGESDPLPPPPPPVVRRASPPAFGGMPGYAPWVVAWTLALLLVLGVFGGGALLVTAWVVGDAITGDDGEERPPARPPPAPPRRKPRR